MDVSARRREGGLDRPEQGFAGFKLVFAGSVHRVYFRAVYLFDRFFEGFGTFFFGSSTYPWLFRRSSRIERQMGLGPPRFQSLSELFGEDYLPRCYARKAAQAKGEGHPKKAKPDLYTVSPT